MTEKNLPIVGVSACLTGEHVRYDGCHKAQALLLEQLAPQLDLRPFCPEKAAGLGVPRPPVQLVQQGEEVAALGAEIKTLDVTDALTETSQRYLHQKPTLHGFIFKSRSPSCGLGSTPIHNHERQPVALGSGLFAQPLQEALPDIPMVEESWLNSEWRCQLFLFCCQLAMTPERAKPLLSQFPAASLGELFSKLLQIDQQQAQQLLN